MEFLILGLLILLNGFFALSEIALVSSQRARLEQMKSTGNGGAKVALDLLDNSEDFLSAVQVGITLIGIVTGVFGGVRLADDIAPLFEQVPALAPYAMEIALTITVIAITYVAIVIGELVPKTMALSNPEGIAAFVAPVIRYFSIALYPFVWLLSFSTELINRALGIRKRASSMTESELRQMIRIASREGVIQAEQNVLHEKVFYFYDKKAKHVMTHRRDVEWIDLNDTVEKQLKDILYARHHRMVVARDSLDQFVGVLSVRDFLVHYQQDATVTATDMTTRPVIIPETMDATAILPLFREQQQYFAVVVSEYGSFEGIITLHDLMENIVGDIPQEGEPSEPDIHIRPDRSALVNGDAPVEVLSEVIENFIIDFEEIDYSTVGGFVLHSLNKVPQTGDSFAYGNYQIEIVDMDGTHVDKVLIVRNGRRGTSEDE